MNQKIYNFPITNDDKLRLMISTSSKTSKDDNSHIFEKCIVCDTNTKMKCSNCHKTRYCCKEHQKFDWKRHKKYCYKNYPSFEERDEICREIVQQTQESFQKYVEMNKSENRKISK